MTDPVFRFHMRYVERSKDLYFHTRWDRAVPAEVLGATRDEAVQKMLDVLGPPGDHSEWAIKIDRIEELPNQQGAAMAERGEQ
ncbi:hypothetical protein ACLD0W_12830 [Alloalcanivorax sp. C16-1]|uniref:hypothetical protein n=1 Tax=Alloalcanivorax sp. C16-1 TaxID=3390051 RepID=UPI0039709E41